MTEYPLVSIIIPAFNYGRFLPETFSNILAQTYTNWECLVVDDGSEDNTREVVEEYIRNDKRFRYLYQTNSGPNRARNQGLKMAKGELIQLLDSDDKLEKDKLKLQVASLNANPEVDIIYSSVRYFTNEEPQARYFDLSFKLKKSWMPNVSGKGWDILPYLIDNNIMVIHSPLFRKTVAEKLKGFDENFRYVEDWDFWLRAALENLNFLYDDRMETIALVRVHESASRNSEKMISSAIQLKEKFTCLLSEKEIPQKDLLLHLNKKSLDKQYAIMSAFYISNDRLKDGWKFTLASLREVKSPFSLLSHTLKYTRKFFKRRALNLFN